MGELVTAAYYFDEFTVQFPRSKHVEDFSWMSSYCYYKLADPWYLDQAYTKKAIDRLQLFITRFPNSSHKEECLGYMTELRERLARKAFEQASLYYKIGYYKAAVQAFRNVLAEYPDSKFREETQKQLVESSLKLAQESIFSKQEERYQQAVEEAEKFNARFPDNKFAATATDMKATAEKELLKIAEIKLEEEEAQQFSKFQRNMRSAIDTREPETETETYTEALEIQKEMQEKFPESKYYPQMQKLLADFDKKKEKEARKQKEPEIQ
jgi:outer membrane protein assembly factor BamD